MELKRISVLEELSEQKSSLIKTLNEQIEFYDQLISIQEVEIQILKRMNQELEKKLNEEKS